MTKPSSDDDDGDEMKDNDYDDGGNLMMIKLIKVNKNSNTQIQHIWQSARKTRHNGIFLKRGLFKDIKNYTLYNCAKLRFISSIYLK